MEFLCLSGGLALNRVCAIQFKGNPNCTWTYARCHSGYEMWFGSHSSLCGLQLLGAIGQPNGLNCASHEGESPDYHAGRGVIGLCLRQVVLCQRSHGCLTMCVVFLFSFRSVLLSSAVQCAHAIDPHFHNESHCQHWLKKKLPILRH